MGIEISKIKIEINEKEFELSVNEAKKLKKILNDTFHEPVMANPIVIQTIYIPERQWQMPHYSYEFWCGETTGSTFQAG